MNQREAFQDTLKAMEQEFYKRPNLAVQIDLVDEASFSHLQDMLVRIREADYTGNKFSESKVGRWLGYAQGVAVARGVLTLEECKAINKSHA